MAGLRPEVDSRVSVKLSSTANMKSAGKSIPFEQNEIKIKVNVQKSTYSSKILRKNDERSAREGWGKNDVVDQKPNLNSCV